MTLKTPIRKGFFAGSGSAAFSVPAVCKACLQLTGKFDALAEALTAPVTIAYLGTATYDMEQPRKNQTSLFEALGCTVVSVAVAEPATTPQTSELRAMISSADCVLVSGGNTLFAVRRWVELGIVDMLAAAAECGAVMAGGSAGAICWFDGGHSDSMDPETYKAAMLGLPPVTSDEASTATTDVKPWKYIRVGGTGFLPGLLCPHHDRTQSNGVPRYVDYNEMLQRHSGERGIAIDHWAALIVEGDAYRVFATPDQPGSGRKDNASGVVDFVTDGSGTPSVWVKYVGEGKSIVQQHVPWSGGSSISELFVPATAIVRDPLEDVCAQENPSS